MVGRPPLSRPARLLFLSLHLSKAPTSLGMTNRSSSSTSASRGRGDHYRSDGVRIAHDPYAPGMAEKYGVPGETDREGFDPYADSVGPGIYGGVVVRDPTTGAVAIGRQYQNHNPRPGPVYAGGGYAPIVRALDDVTEKLIPLLEKYPGLVNDVTTGGARPLHMCGMSRGKQRAVGALAERGADVEALDAYGMTPLHRMASNNLAEGAKMLLDAGADAFNPGKIGASPMSVARDSAAREVVKVLKEGQEAKLAGSKANVRKLNVMGSVDVPEVNGDYLPRSPEEIPTGFASVCQAQGWDINDTWAKLNGLDPVANMWFAHAENESYVYHNRLDGKWWIDGPDGNGVWIAEAPSHAPPDHGWAHATKRTTDGSPMVRTFRKVAEKK